MAAQRRSRNGLRGFREDPKYIAEVARRWGGNAASQDDAIRRAEALFDALRDADGWAFFDSIVLRLADEPEYYPVVETLPSGQPIYVAHFIGPIECSVLFTFDDANVHLLDIVDRN